MKIKFDLKNKKGDIDVNAEKLVEKGMDQHEKNWKDKFNTRHNAKKEILELKHKQKIETTEQELKKKTIVQEIFDGINSKKQLELEEKRKIEEEKRRLEEERLKREEEERLQARKERKQLGSILLIVGFIMIIFGFGLSTNADTEVSMIGSIGFFGCIAGFVLLVKNDKKR